MIASLTDKLAEWLSHHLLPCPYMKHFGLPCPGCGMQRAMIALLKGQILESIRTYPALIPILFLIIFLILHLIFKFHNGAYFLRNLFIGTVAIIIIHYIYVVIETL